VPDHSTFSKNRHGRFRQSDLLRHVFEAVLRWCIDEGLVGGENFAVDSSLIKADANRQNGIEGEKGLPQQATARAVREYLAVLDDAAFGAATEVTPKFISPADPAARWTGAHGGQAFFAYATNYLIDTDHAIIVDVEATTAIRQAEVLAARRMLERTAKNLALQPRRLLGDSAYGSAEMLGWLVSERHIEPHVTVFDKSARHDGTFSRDDFHYDPERDVYLCPGGNMLTTTGTRVNDDATLLYRASKADCQARALKNQCSRQRQCAECPAQSTKMRMTLHVRSQNLGKAGCHDGCARKSRCCSRTSSASSSSTVLGFVDQPALAMSSYSQQPGPKPTLRSAVARSASEGQAEVAATRNKRMFHILLLRESKTLRAGRARSVHA
jgi:hypothetical protein